MGNRRRGGRRYRPVHRAERLEDPSLAWELLCLLGRVIAWSLETLIKLIKHRSREALPPARPPAGPVQMQAAPGMAAGPPPLQKPPDKSDSEPERLFGQVRFRRTRLLTKGELAFFWSLLRVAPASHRVFCKVRLADLVNVWAPSRKRRLYAVRRLSQKHVDFVLFNRTTAQVELVVELDDQTHSTSVRVARDKLVDHVLTAAGIAVLHVPCQVAYDVEDLRDQVGRNLTSQKPSR